MFKHGCEWKELYFDDYWNLEDGDYFCFANEINRGVFQRITNMTARSLDTGMKTHIFKAAEVLILKKMEDN